MHSNTLQNTRCPPQAHILHIHIFISSFNATQSHLRQALRHFVVCICVCVCVCACVCVCLHVRVFSCVHTVAFFRWLSTWSQTTHRHPCPEHVHTNPHTLGKNQTIWGLPDTGHNLTVSRQQPFKFCAFMIYSLTAVTRQKLREWLTCPLRSQSVSPRSSLAPFFFLSPAPQPPLPSSSHTPYI